MMPFHQYSLIYTLCLLAHIQFVSASHNNFTPRSFSSGLLRAVNSVHRWRRDDDNNADRHKPTINFNLASGLPRGIRKSSILGELARRSLLPKSTVYRLRGGASDDKDDSTDTDKEKQKQTTPKSKTNNKKKQDHDEERYSRQMYALGARAHGLVRSTTAILYGPLGKITRGASTPVTSGGEHGFRSLHEGTNGSGNNIPSGLLYEIAKNLALSGVGRIILVQNDASHAGYFDGAFDDLGAAYHRAALSEVFPTSHLENSNAMKDRDQDILEVEDEDYSDELDESGDNGAILLAEYIQRLNPGVKVDILSRKKLLELLREDNVEEGDDWDAEEETISLGSNPVMVCVDRSIAAMLEMNDACRQRCQSGDSPSVPFVSVKTAGVYSQIFCDFGPTFLVVDEDGETPRSTLVDKIESSDGDNELLTVHCLEGERHDVSRGDVIEFQGEHSADEISISAFPQCEVVAVKSPTCFTIKERKDDASDESLLHLLSNAKARSFTRIKLPRTISFSSLRDILHPVSSANENEDGDPNDASISCCDDDSLFVPSDLDKSFDPQRRKAIMASLAALDKFVTKYGRLPCRFSKPNDDDDSTKQQRTDLDRFQSLVKKITKSESTEAWDRIITQFATSCRAKFTPIQAISGALAAQEVLKAATGLYNPVKQFLLYDCDEVLEPSASTKDSDNKERNEASEANLIARGQSYILGNELSQKLASSRIFLVGAGAIGCELLKNLSAMGAGTYQSGSKDGCLVVTDMDTIEKSNLSRQLLFRDHDVGEFKSAAARSAVLRFLPTCQIEAHTSRVGEEEDGPFDDDFWSSGCDVVLNALDNVEARLFVDSQCVSNGRGLIDAGTLGPKGNVQVVVPYQSESYGSSADPPEPDIPVCTLKNFPYDISHTIQWARDLFDGYFHRRPRQANDHVAEIAQMEDLTAFANMLIRKLGDDAALDMAEELGEDIGVHPFTVGLDSNDPEHFAAVKRVSLNWAIRQADRLFYLTIKELLEKHPIDSVDEDGAPFWTGSRRVPTPVRFKALNSGEDEVSARQVIINERIAQFVQSAARLRMESFLQESHTSGEDATASTLVSLEDALSFLEYRSSTMQNKKEAENNNRSGDILTNVLESLNGAKTGASFLPRLNLVDFEKDDESNGHVAFVTAASNLRALAYGIPAADATETRRVAGRIVPAMITTTGLVSALSCLELVKMLKSLPLQLHRNAFVNLALPFFAFTSPLPADQVVGVNGKPYTMWDNISIKGSTKSPTDTMTLRKFIDKVKKAAEIGDGMEVGNISYGPYMIYASFLNSDDEELLNSPLMSIVNSAVISEDESGDMALGEGAGAEDKTEESVNLTDEQKATLSRLAKKRYIDFSASVEDTVTGEEYELPPIRLIKEKKPAASRFN